MDLCEFEASLVYKVSSRTSRATQLNLVSKNKRKSCLKAHGEVSTWWACEEYKYLDSPFQNILFHEYVTEPGNMNF